MGLTPRIPSSTVRLGSAMPNRRSEMNVAQAVVSCVVVSLAKTPLRAAQPPEAMA